MVRIFHWTGMVAATLAISLTGAGCASLGSILNGGGLGGRGTQLVGEVSYVDTRYQEVEIQTNQGAERVEYDNRTVVYYQNRQYDVTALEQGDLVAADVQNIGGGRLYTQRIDVRQTAQQRGYNVGAARESVQKLTGYVGWLDPGSRTFQLRLVNRQTVVIRMPADASSGDRKTFGRLKRGSHVRLQVEWTGDDSARLVRFV